MKDIKINYINGENIDTSIAFGCIEWPKITIESRGKKGVMDFTGSMFRYEDLGLSFQDAVKILFGGLTEKNNHE